MLDTAIFIIWGTGQEQPWNNPAKIPAKMPAKMPANISLKIQDNESASKKKNATGDREDERNH